ncbi:MAG: DSD1 family PLP-dependent enzyme [Deltaproteobacteria bacterium]|jgi:3-hydroxy-D-aspartate aldolase|nr:DSD1 family PLP-dependent enzyme [Deltaproteobacteria bacterium]
MLESHIKTPALVLDMDVFERNIRRMSEFAQSIGVKLRPHYKSHKSPDIARIQIKNGAGGISCAKLDEAEDLVLAGIDDVFITNQVVERGKVAKLADLARCCRLAVCVDQAENIRDLQAAAAFIGSTIRCFVEFDIGMNRCGVHSREEFLELARQIKASPHLEFMGIQAYAGQLAHEEDFAKRKAASEQIERDLTALKKFLEKNGVAVPEVSGTSTGTAFFRPQGTVYTELQPGSYIFVDVSYNALGLPFENSLFALATIMSVSNGEIINDCGLKAMSVDQRPPKLLEAPEATLNFSEEHSQFTGKAADYKIGDHLHLIPSHCCTTVNLYDYIYFVRRGKVENRVRVFSRGKSL